MSKRAIETTDLFQLHSVTNPTLSPTGKAIVFLKTHIDKEANDYVTQLYHQDLETEVITQWTYGAQRISSPSWSPDGTHIAFLSNRGDKNQLYLMSTTGGEARQLTNLSQGVTRFLWSPCGEKIWMNALAKEGQPMDAPEEEKDEQKPEPIRVTTMKYKMDGVGILPQQTFQQIGILTIETGEIDMFTDGAFHHTLEAISHCGKQLIIGANRKEQQQLDFEFRQSLFVVDVETKQEKVLMEEEGYYGGAHFSLDNRYIAFVGYNRQFENATHPRLFVYDTVSSITIDLTESLDLPLGDQIVADHQQSVFAPSVVWTKDNHLYFQVSTMGDVRLYVATLDGELYPATPENEHVYSYDVMNDGTTAIVAVSHPTEPGELFKLTIATGNRKPLTAFNQAFVKAVTLVEPQPLVLTGATGWNVYGWLMKPTSFQADHQYPLIVNIHGGPHAMYGNTFFHEMQLLAAQGYGVLYVNPRGSHGYSQTFVDAVRGDYGGNDYADIMAAVDTVLASEEWIDSTRLGVTGGSYGGFMTNWIVGHTDRFKAAVTQRSISNWISFFGVSDIGYYFSDWQLKANMKDVEKLWQHSPLKYAEQVNTPLLILHSENDYRCPIEQAEQLYITLKSLGKKTEFVRFPKADHNLSRTGKPNLRITRLTEIVNWFQKWL